MRRVIYGLIGLVVVVVVVAFAALLIVPGLVDWNPYKDRIVAEARDLLGRDLRVEGRIGFTILPAPALSLGKVRLANIEGGSAADMAKAEALRVRVALLPLITGSVQVETVALEEPRVLLEVLADGRRNWDFPAVGASGAASASPNDAAGDAEEGFFRVSQVRIESFSVTGGTLIYRDARDGTEERIESLDAAIAAESLAGPVSATGTATARGVAGEFDLGVGRMVRSGAIPFNATVALTDTEARLQVAGSLSNQPEGLRYRAQVKAEGSDFGQVLRHLSGGGGGGDLPARSFTLEAEVEGDEALLQGKEVRVALGDLALSGDVTARLGTPLDLALDLRAGRIDLDALFAAAEVGAEAAGDAPAETAEAGPAITRAGGSGLWSPPKSIRADLALFVEGAVYRGQALRQIALEAGLDDGVLSVTRARAQLPAGSDLSLSGSLTASDGAPRYDGQATLTSDNVRGLAEWLGADLSAVPSSRLRRFDFSGRIHGDAAQINLADLEIGLDLTRITGGLVAALRDRPGLGIGLAVDSINLDAYFPAPTAAVPVENTDSEPAEAAPAEAAPVGTAALAWLDRFDANLDLRLGSLTTGGTKLADLKLDGTLRDGALTVRDASIGELAGGSASFAGLLENLAGVPRLDGTLDLRVGDPLRLARAAGLEPETLAPLGAFGLTAALSGTVEALTLDSELTAQGGRFGFAGTLQPAARPLAFDLAVTARHPDLARLLAAMEAGPRLGAGFGRLDLKGRVAGTPLALAVSDLIGTVGPLAVKGRLDADLAGPSPAVRDLDLDLNLVHADLGGLAGALGVLPAPGSGLGPVDLKAKLTGDNLRPALAGLAGRLGPAELVAGTLGADLSGDRPVVDAKLEAAVLPLAALAAPAAGGKRSGSRRWSTERIDLAALRALDGTFDIQAKLLTHDKLKIENATIDAALAGGVLELRRLSGTLAGGALEVTGTLAAGSPVAADFAVTATRVQAKPLLKALADFNRLSGPVDLEARFSASGTSEARLVAGLSGTGKVSGTLTAKSKSEERLGALALGLLGAEVKKVEDLGQATLLLFSSFADAPAELTGTFAASGGVIRSEDLRLRGRRAEVLTRGQAHLPAWKLDATSEVYPDDRPDRPSLALRFEGPLDSPAVKVVGLSRRGGGQAPAAGQAAPPEQPETKEILPGVEVPKDLKPEDVIKNLLKGLGN